jgi:release factor glutamine methyltransferase
VPADAGPARTWTVRDLLAWSRQWFDERGVDSPRLTGELLLAHVLSLQRIRLYTDIDRPLDKAELGRFRDLVRRRAAGEPTQYLIGYQEFYGRRFKVDARALIPRPETELIAERILRAFPKDQAARFADIGCGCGTLGLTLAAERPTANVVLTDISPDAVALARENAVLNDVAARVDVRVGDLTAPLGDDVFDAVVTNLPYVPDAERHTLPVHIREHEPPVALYGGPDGLDVYRRFVPAIARHVRPGGWLVFEHGAEHGDRTPALLDPAHWSSPTVEADLAGFDRFTWAIRR